MRSQTKLPVRWPWARGQEPLYYDHNLTQFPEDRPNSRSRYQFDGRNGDFHPASSDTI